MTSMFTGPVAPTATNSGAGGGRAFSTAPPPTTSSTNLLTTGGARSTTTGKPTFSYAGQNRGNYIQECHYRYVGPSAGEFEKVPAPQKSPNYALVCGFIMAAAVVGTLVYVIRTPAKPAHGGLPQPKLRIGSSSAHPEVRTFDCKMQALTKGEKVQAGADISFNQGGNVPEGTYGEVAEHSAGREDSIVVIDWEGFPDLAHAHVTRNLVIKAVDTGDRVQAVMDIRFTPEGEIHDAPLRVTDLVRATSALGRVTKGSYGTVVTMTGDQIVVKFADSAQLSTVKVARGHIAKAPQVDDHVQAVSDISCGSDTVYKGAFGSVITMQPLGSTFSYVVDFPDVDGPCKNVGGYAMKVVAGPIGRATIPQGTKGTVTERKRIDGNSQFDYIIAWDGLAGAGARVTRDEIIKVEQWSPVKTEYCCSHEGVGCDAAAAAPQSPFAPSATKAVTSPTTTPPKYNCFAEGVWSPGQATWCCENHGFGCARTTSAEPLYDRYRCDTQMVDADGNTVWSKKKTEWCCENKALGCKDA